MQSRYQAPFGPSQSHAVDAALAERLLSTALAGGGDYADLFFEYRASGSFVFDEGILKTAGRGVDVGLGVRVQKGEATGYAYVEELTEDAMLRAAKTAGAIALGGGASKPAGLQSRDLPRRYELDSLSSTCPGPPSGRCWSAPIAQPGPTTRGLIPHRWSTREWTDH